jgi:hypothetical protein
MAPSFLKDLRRRSRASFRTDKSTDSSNASNGTVPTTKSTSTLNSTYGSQTPPSALQSSSSSSNLFKDQTNQAPPVPVRPQISTSSSKRYSTGMYGLGSPSSANGNPTLPTSPYAPRITSIHDGAWVGLHILQHSRKGLIHTIGKSENPLNIRRHCRPVSTCN